MLQIPDSAAWSVNIDSEPIQVIRMEIQNNPIFQFEIDGTLQEAASLKELSVGEIFHIEEEEFAPVHSATHTNAVMYIVKFIRENFATATLNDIAESLHYSPAYLSQILKENLGMNFNQLLDLRRSVVGRKLLLETKKSLEDTALELGFQSYSGFYKFWVKQQGLSPKEYREQYSKENVKIDKKIRRIR